MCKGLIGEKIGMTGVFMHDGRYVPVTVLKVGPCVVTQIKKRDKDGYQALQISFGNKKLFRTTKPLRGHFGKIGADCFRIMKEVDVDNVNEYELGQVLGPEIFKIGERVDVSGVTKGRGFAGVMKRHGFSGGKKTHGSKSHRVPGSIGCSAWPGRVIKGKKMPGHHGYVRKTVRNLEIIDIRQDENVILVKGPVPGSKFGEVMVRKLKFSG